MNNAFTTDTDDDDDDDSSFYIMDDFMVFTTVFTFNYTWVQWIIWEKKPLVLESVCSIATANGLTTVQSKKQP